MTDEEVQKIYADLEKEFGDNLPNYQHQPRQFLYYIKLYIHKKNLERLKNL